MGKDRQIQKNKKSKRTESDRDQEIHNKGATRLDTPEAARRVNRH